jgi:integrase
MIQLQNNCRAGKMSVHPSNWKTSKASLKIPWRISYWFFDDNINKKLKVVIKGMNHLQTINERRAAVELLISDENDLIQRQAYNRITKVYGEINDSEISSLTPFKESLYYAFEHITVAPNTKIDVKGALFYFSLALEKRGYTRLPIKDITTKHIKLALHTCGEIKKDYDIPIGKTGKFKKGKWTANTFNNYRKYLSSLFSELLELQVVTHNPVTFVKKLKGVKKIRETLSTDERRIVDKAVHDYDYHFWRFMHIFFHSGSRETEMVAVKKCDVDIDRQRFKVLVKKGKHYQEEWRVLKTIVVDLWKEVLNQSNKEEHLFSIGLKPGSHKIRAEQITRRWRRHVKKKLNITADFYSLKHSNLDDIAALHGIEAAQVAAGHSTPVITMNYATHENERQLNRIKNIGNSFS